MAEVLRLVAIGFMGYYRVYVNVSAAEAVARHDRENPTETVADCNHTVREITVPAGVFEVYDIWEPE